MFSSKRKRFSRRLKEPFGKAGLTVAILALVLAMVGGAYAAGGGLNGKQKKEVTKIAKKYAGKPGPAGAPGPAGSAGATGPAGAVGPAGAAGKAGATGTEGPEGPEGSPWTAGGVLPEGQTEKGVWAVAGKASEKEEASAAPISFTIPLEVGPTPHFIGEEAGEGEANFNAETFPAGCKGTAENPANVANPIAQPGNLCVYAHQVFNAKPYLGLGFLNVEAGGIGAGQTGTALLFESEAAGNMAANGVWAVTAE
jgi:hypothetical protein